MTMHFGRDEEGGAAKRDTRHATEETAKRSNSSSSSSRPASATTTTTTVSRRRLLCRQTFAAIGPIASTVAAGATIGYSAVLLPQLRSEAILSNSTFGGDGGVDDLLFARHYNDPDGHPPNATNVQGTEEESWIAASGTLLMAPGCWLAGTSMDLLGRRTSNVLLGPLFVLGWWTVALAPSTPVLIAGRAVCGLCVGLQGPLGPVYVAETSEPRLRGILLAGISTAVALGISISHVLGTWLSWRVAAHLCALLPAAGSICCLFAPESPTWLLARSRPEEAREAWIYLRGENCGDVESKPLGSEAAAENVERRVRWRDPAFLKPLLVLAVFSFASQFSGVNAVVSYCVQLLNQVSGDARKAYPATLILDLARVVASLAACWLSNVYPRRTLAVGSGLGSAACLLALGSVVYADYGRPWIPTALLLGYVCAVSVGMVPLPWLLCGELFPASLRGLGSGISSSITFACFFLVVKTGPATFRDLGIAGTFSLYGSIALGGTVFLYFFMPETKDRTLREIQELATADARRGQSKEIPEKAIPDRCEKEGNGWRVGDARSV